MAVKGLIWGPVEYFIPPGSDVKRDDGIYSSYVTSFTATGRYNVHVVVRDVTGTVVSDGVVGVGVPRLAARGSRTGHNRNLTPVQPFQRFSSAGSFTLEGYDGRSKTARGKRQTALAVSISIKQKTNSTSC